MSSSINNTPAPVITANTGSFALHRGEMLLVAVVGIVLGIIALLWQDVTLVIVGVIFGAYLVVSGIVRFWSAVVSRHVGAGQRFLVALLGLIVFAAGIICLFYPERSVVLLAFVIGIGWIASGLVDLIGAAAGAVVPRWVGFVSGLFFVLAGLVALLLPVLTVEAFIFVAAILLIAVSLMSILTLPRRGSNAAW
jgi:uncharacterized membrane protein HdeD (DUF308 family)